MPTATLESKSGAIAPGISATGRIGQRRVESDARQLLEVLTGLAARLAAANQRDA